MMLPIAAWLLATNAVTYAAFAIDKASAMTGERRISETRLLQFAIFGGSPAALWARRHLRHETRKQPFYTRLKIIAMVHAGIVGGLGLFWAMR